MPFRGQICTIMSHMSTFFADVHIMHGFIITVKRFGRIIVHLLVGWDGSGMKFEMVGMDSTCRPDPLGAV